MEKRRAEVGVKGSSEPRGAKVPERAAEPVAAAPKQAASQPVEGRAKKKILLVDDSMTALMMNRMLLSKTSCDIVTARDGREAIEKALSERPDLVVMDIVMPQMNGFEACKRLRALDATRSTPILLVTTRGEAESIATGFASGCTDYITKPVNSVELLAKIKTYLGE
jgi:PleD family two-component response regulator